MCKFGIRIKLVYNITWSVFIAIISAGESMRPHLVDYLPTHEMSDQVSLIEILLEILLKIMEMVLYTELFGINR